jgi:hypothetical protein
MVADIAINILLAEDIAIQYIDGRRYCNQYIVGRRYCNTILPDHTNIFSYLRGSIVVFALCTYDSTHVTRSRKIGAKSETDLYG